MSNCAQTNHSSPIGVMWKTVSEDCNLACDYCYYSRVGGKIGPKINRIESEVLEKFIREYMELSNGQVSFAWQGGEPLLAGLDFFKEVVYLQAKYAPSNTNISNALQTNGMLLNRDWANFFGTYNFLVGVSIDGPKDIHDSRRVTRSGNGSFDRVMKGIQTLRDANVDFNILTVIHEGNVRRAAELMKFYHEEGFDYVQFIPCMDFRAQEVHTSPKYLITPEEYGQFLCDAFDIWYSNGNPTMSVRFFDNILNVYLQQEAEICTHRSVCPTTIVLEQNGDAYPCDFYINEEYKIGNVWTSSLRDILGDIVYSNFLSKKPNLPLKCMNCQYLSLCHGGCPRNRTWHESEEFVDVDYFCKSYLQIYDYADQRMQNLAKKVRLRQHISAGYQVPGRNEPCICGSGKKYKKCCGV